MEQEDESEAVSKLLSQFIKGTVKCVFFIRDRWAV